MRHGPLPLRSSQSIGHRQQIKYWSCLLDSTFFYSETPFYLCLAAVHTYTQMKLTSYVKTCPAWGRGMHSTCPKEAALLHPALLGKEEENNAPAELWEPGHNFSESPSGAHQKSKNKITDASLHQPLLAPTAENSSEAAPSTLLRAAARAQRFRADARVLSSFIKEK